MTDEFLDEIEYLKRQSKEVQKESFGERDTIQAVIRPFIRALGYQIDNRKEVAEEHYPDKELNRNRVDFSINIDEKQIIILEAKAAKKKLHTPEFLDQLSDYYKDSDAKIGILTNGVEAWFYSDLNETNVMDKEPFFIFNFQKNNDSDISFLKLFYKNEFSLEKIIEQAKKMKKDFSAEVEKLYQKYRQGIKQIADGIKEKSTKDYFGYKKNGKRRFCYLKRQSNSIRVDLNLNSIEVLGDHADGCISYNGKGPHGVATHYVEIDLDNKNYDYIIEQIRRTYEHAD